MSSDVILGILALVAIGAVAGFVGWDRDRISRTTVEGALLRYHATDIRLKLDLMDWDRDNFTYDVEYTDTSGKRRYNRCKVNVRDDAVFWEQPMIAPPRLAWLLRYSFSKGTFRSSDCTVIK